MGLVLPSLLIQPLEDLVGVRVYVEVHLLVVVLQQVLGVRVEFLVDLFLGLDVSGLARDDVHDEVLQWAILAGVLEVDGRGIAGVEALHCPAQQLEGQR